MNTLKATIKWVAAIVVICAVAVFLANINGLSVSRTFATVGGNEVTEAEYKYYLELIKSEMLTEAGVTDAEGYWDTEIDGKKASDVAKERALDEVIRTETAVVKAQEAGITLTEEEISNARAAVEGDSADTKAQIAAVEDAIGADKYQLADIMEKSALASKYYQYVSAMENSPVTPSEEAINAEAEESYACVKHVLISNTPEESTDVTFDANGEASTPAIPAEEQEAYSEEAKKKAEEVLAKAVAGENFESLIKEYGEDPGMESTPDGYLINEYGYTLDGSMMIREFTDGAFAVKAGEVNPQLVESSYGWHIIKRYPLPTESEDYGSVLSTTTSTVSADLYYEYLDGFRDSMNVTYNEKMYNKIKVK